MTRPEQRADDRQRGEVRAELHAIVDGLVDALPVLERQARDMGRGFPSQAGGPSGGGGVSRPVERIALDGGSDPGALAGDALVEWARVLGGLRALDRRVRGLLPVQPAASVEPAAGRVPRCESCGASGDAFKMGRWCEGCYRRLLRRRAS